MDLEGPALETLIRRIAETPAVFLEPLSLAALVHDLLEQHGVAPARFDPSAWSWPPTEGNRSRIAAVLCWLLADPTLHQAAPGLARLTQALEQVPAELALQLTAESLIEHGDRREELARLSLARMGYRPAGESLHQAQDRLTTISTTERVRVVAASRAAEQRAREIREALARKAAEESADKWGRE